jgi:hypothetical protein
LMTLWKPGLKIELSKALFLNSPGRPASYP